MSLFQDLLRSLEGYATYVRSLEGYVTYVRSLEGYATIDIATKTFR